MKKYQISTIGSFHTNHNEDALAIHEIDNRHFLIAIMDGCSMGNDSHFASTLIGKILKKIAKELTYKSFLGIATYPKKNAELLKTITKELFFSLRAMQNNLILETEELLITLILGIINPTDKKADILTIGDGLICHNGAYIEYDHDNQPDYLGYHLGSDFEEWYATQKQLLHLKNIKDLSIASDGIFTFRAFSERTFKPKEEEDILHFLLVDEQHCETEKMLFKKILFMERGWGLKPTDDLSIIRLVI
jgi:hypothetical protein